MHCVQFESVDALKACLPLQIPDFLMGPLSLVRDTVCRLELLGQLGHGMEGVSQKADKVKNKPNRFNLECV